MTSEFIMALLEKHGLAAVVIAVLAWAYWKKDQQLAQLQAQAWKELKDMTVAMNDSANVITHLTDLVRRLGERK